MQVNFILPATRDICSPCPLQASWGSCCMSFGHGRGEKALSKGLCLISTQYFLYQINVWKKLSLWEDYFHLKENLPPKMSYTNPEFHGSYIAFSLPLLRLILFFFLHFMYFARNLLRQITVRIQNAVKMKHMYILEWDFREIPKKNSICPNLPYSRNVTFLQEEISPRFPWQRLLDNNSVEASICFLSSSFTLCSPQNGLRLIWRVEVPPQSTWSHVQHREGTGSHSTGGHAGLRVKEQWSSAAAAVFASALLSTPILPSHLISHTLPSPHHKVWLLGSCFLRFCWAILKETWKVQGKFHLWLVGRQLQGHLLHSGRILFLLRCCSFRTL